MEGWNAPIRDVYSIGVQFMMGKTRMVRSLGAIEAAAGCLAMASVASAGSTVLGNSGWTASWPDAFDVQLEVLGEGNGQLMLSKTVTFNELNSVPITFQQTKADAAGLVSITEEALTNNTGSDWGQFRFILLSGDNGTTSQPHFDIDATNIGGVDGFSINPFTQHEYQDNAGQPNTNLAKVLSLTDGTVANGDVFRPGKESGQLVIAAYPAADGGNGGQVFTLKELPGVGPNVIPLPSALWSGLIGLTGLALFAGSRAVARRSA